MKTIPEITFCPLSERDRKPVIDLFNYYIENSFAAYPEQPVPYEFFSLFLDACRNYPSVTVRLGDDTVGGFGMLRPHNPMPVFRHTAEITYFLGPDLTGKGIGARMLAYLEAEGADKGITTLLASISSLNEGSIRFHTHHGFTECGRFNRVGIKKGITFDTVWMQKVL